jgi:hypothetical protein
VYRNNTRPLAAGADGAGVESCFGDSWISRSFTSGVPSSPSGLLSSRGSSDASFSGAVDAATLRTPPVVAWNVFRGWDGAETEGAVGEGVGAGVGYE